MMDVIAGLVIGTLLGAVGMALFTLSWFAD